MIPITQKKGLPPELGDLLSTTQAAFFSTTVRIQKGLALSQPYICAVPFRKVKSPVNLKNLCAAGPRCGRYEIVLSNSSFTVIFKMVEAEQIQVL